MTTYRAIEEKCLEQAGRILDKLPENENHRLASVCAACRLLEMAQRAARSEKPPEYPLGRLPRIQLEAVEEGEASYECSI